MTSFTATVLAASNSSVTNDVAFTASCDGTRQKYVQVLPADFTPNKPVDILIVLHGHGSDRWQFIRQDRPECRAVRDVARQRGMILISPDYRAKTSWMGPKAEADLVQIISELKEKYSTRRVFLCGASMGGSSCLTFAALHPQLLAGVASMNGTANHLEYENFQDAISQSFGGSKSEVPEVYKQRSAELWPERFTMPVSFSVGGKDRSVPPDSVLRLAAKLKAAGRDILLIHRKDGGHSTTYADGVKILEFAIDRATPASPVPTPNKKPNIVFFLVDDLGWTDLGCYGSDFYQTPHIDRLAAEGVRFTDAYAACNACSPTRAAVLTGKYPARLKLTDWIPGQRSLPAHKLLAPAWTQQLEHHHTTLAEALKSDGYRTIHIGKWHLGGTEFYPTKQGFDINIGGSYIGAPGSYYYPYYRKPGSASGPIENLPPGGPEGRYLTDRLTDEAVRLIDESKNEPFFLYLASYSVHTPIQPRADLKSHYENKVTAGKRHKNPNYAAMVGAVDESVGRVLQQLKDSGVADNTLIIFTSDNGGMHKVTSNLPLRGGKGMAWEGGTRVPLIVKAPGLTPAGTICREPVISVDFYPTLLDIVGAGDDSLRDREIDGVSLTSLLRSPDTKLKRDAIFWHYPHYNVLLGVPHSSIRAGRYKLIEFFEDNHIELFDLKNDLGEKINLAKDHPDKASELLKSLQAWRGRVAAQLPISKSDASEKIGDLNR
jgi:arylsulfatase A